MFELFALENFDVMRSARFNSNTGLLDARGTAQILYNLSSHFTAVEFADFCSIAEEIVLRDQIILVGNLDKLPRHLKLQLKSFLDDGVFVSPGEAFPIPDLPSDPRQLCASADAIECGLTSASIDDATFEARRLLGGEAYFGVVATPLLRQLQHFGLVRRPSVENGVWDLAAQYRKLSEAAIEIRRDQQLRSELPYVSVPPIALLALQRSKYFEAVVGELFELRSELRALRLCLSDIEDRMREGKLSPKECKQLEEQWRQRWTKLAQELGAPENNRMALVSTSIPLLKNGYKIVKDVIKADYFSAVLSAAEWIGPGFEALGARQVRPIHRPVSNYLTTTDVELKRAVARIFATDFMKLDSDLKALAYHPNTPWRLAADKTVLRNKG